MNNIFYVIEMLRNDDREQHSYVLGIYDNEQLARSDALEYISYRGGKYGAEIRGYTINERRQMFFLKILSDTEVVNKSQDIK